jgi:acetyl esterase
MLAHNQSGDGADIDPDIREFIRITSQDYGRFAGEDPANHDQRRQTAEKVRVPWVQGGPIMHSTQDLTLDKLGVRVRIHKSRAEPANGTLLYVHGGGWVLFSIDTHDRLMREYAARSGLDVVGIDYSLSPENRYPTALNEISAMIDWLRESGEQYGLNTKHLAIGGDSVGANMSLATSIAMRDRDTPLDAMMLSYGAYDTEHRPSYDRFDGPHYMLTTQEMLGFWQDYLGTQPVETAALARPLHANLQGLPPAFLCIAPCDVLADENYAMAEKLKTAGVDVTTVVYEGATHSFLEAMSISGLADQALADASAWLKQRFDKA